VEIKPPGQARRGLPDLGLSLDVSCKALASPVARSSSSKTAPHCHWKVPASGN